MTGRGFIRQRVTMPFEIAKVDLVERRYFWLLLVFAVTPIASGEDISFNRDIRPILSDFCFACHGPDEHSREADLRLDDRDAAVEYGAIEPEDADASLIIERIESTDESLVMPPAKSGKTLSTEQRELLRRWIEAGAVYQSHWSFSPVPKQVVIPQVAEFSQWATTDLDHFVAAKFESRGLRPAAEAERAQWLRRVTLDLNGLPPTIRELDAFLTDDSPDAYQRVVDRLLENDAYGERMASMWLDVARYADTFGYQNDVAMEVWPWRDWVIRAFNDNLPYDDFLTWQIAGDLLPEATTDQKLATTFNRLHRQTNEGGSIPEEFRIANIADRTTTTGTAFLGMTLECSRCHDHKYDPIQQRDFYRLSAYFADIDEFGLYAHFTHGVPTPALLLYAGDQQAQHENAIAKVVECEQRLSKAIESARQQCEQKLDGLPNTFPVAPEAEFHHPLDGEEPGVIGNATRCNGDDQIECKDFPEFGRHDPFTISLWVKPALQQPRMLVLHQSVAAEDSAFRGLQLTIDDGHPEFSLIHFWPGNALRVATIETIPVDHWSHLTVTHDGSGKASGIKIFIDGREAKLEIERDQLTRDIKHVAAWKDMKVGDVPFALGARFRDVGFRDGRLDDLQVSTRRLSDAEVASIYLAAKKTDESLKLSDPMRIQHHLVHSDDHVRSAEEALLAARRRENEIVTGVREIMTMRTAVIPRETFLLNRGEYTNRGEQLRPGTPGFLVDASSDKPDRLALARWLTDDANPLASRVIANRLWHLFFGRGIVVSLEDFGSQGVPPSHPELLDWLARSLMDDGWDLKRLCRRIVLSTTYRQSSLPADPEFFESDPSNHWLARGPRHRLSAEQVRDAVLFASGLLVQEIGGPSVMPYQPAGLWKEAGTGKTYQQSSGEGLYRRSLYTFWKRTSPPPSMLTFDATSRETCTAKRELTTTPLQALVVLNDPQFVEAARVLSEQLLSDHPHDKDARWVQACRSLISRPPTDAELRILGDLYEEQATQFETHPELASEFLEVGEREAKAELPPVDLAATTVVVATLFGYDETMMKR